MAKYLIILKNKREGTLTTDLLKSHVEHIRSLDNKGVLCLCGPFADNDGAMQILEAETLEEAKKYLLQDPFIVQKYYGDYSIHEFIEGNSENSYLMTDDQTNSNLKNE